MVVKTPEIIYHYCSAEALMGILSNKYIRLSPFYDMNDSSEGRMILNVAQDYLESGNPKSEYADYRMPWEFVKEYYKMFMPTAFYTACFCIERDLLSQWRAYAKEATGFAIGFSTKKLNIVDAVNHKNSKDRQIALKEVFYWEEEKIFEDIIEKELKKLLPFEENNINKKQIKRAAMNLLKKTYISKNSFFKEEKEWRIIYTPSHRDNADILKSEFVTKNDNIKQYFRLDFEPDCIVEIVQGPRNKTNADILKNFLHSNGILLDSSKIIKSKGSDIFK